MCERGTCTYKGGQKANMEINVIGKNRERVSENLCPPVGTDVGRTLDVKAW